LAVLNKCDLPAKFDVSNLPEALSDSISISAKDGTGIENMLEKIRQVCDVVSCNLKKPVCFTLRQENLLRQLENIESIQQATSIITELLNGKLSV